MTNITIPPEALKKSARSLARITHRNLSKIHTLTKTEDEFVEENWPAFVEHARAAALALLENWPGIRAEVLEEEAAMRAEARLLWPGEIPAAIRALKENPDA